MTVPPSQVCSRPPPVEWRELIRQQACLRHAGPLTTDLCCAESARRCRPRAPPSPRQAFGDRTYERIRIDIELWNRRLLHTARSRGQWVVNVRVDSFAPFHYLFGRRANTDFFRSVDFTDARAESVSEAVSKSIWKSRRFLKIKID